MLHNLILGIIDNYKYADIAPFIDSLAKINFVGKVCFFAGPNLNEDVIPNLLKKNIDVIRYHNKFPYIDNPHQNNFQSLPQPIHIYNFRHYIYYNYILHQEKELKNVLLTDIRDVVFQKDPFDFPMENALYVAMEPRDSPIAIRETNYVWLYNGYGPSVVEEMKPHDISCAGTTMGPVHHIKSYLFKMLCEINKYKDALNCADQAAHNVLLHRNQLTPVIKLYDINTPIITVAAMHIAAAVKLNAKGLITDNCGYVVNIIHQYDRQPFLKKIIFKNLYKEKFYYFNRHLLYLYLNFRYKFLVNIKHQLLLKFK